MASCVDADRGLDRIGFDSGILAEIGFPEPAGRGGAVRHGEGAVASSQSSGKHVDPRRDDRCDVLQEVVRCSEAEVLREFVTPCEALVRVAPEAKRTGIRSVDVSRLAERDEVHVDASFGDVEESEHESEIILACFVDSDRSTMRG